MHVNHRRHVAFAFFMLVSVVPISSWSSHARVLLETVSRVATCRVVTFGRLLVVAVMSGPAGGAQGHLENGRGQG